MLRRWIVSMFVTLVLAMGLFVVAALATEARGPAVTVTEFALPHANSRPYTIVTGSDGNLWFTESTRSTIGWITPSGTFTEWYTVDDGIGSYGITLGSDGNLWFTERFANRIAKITPTGTITEYDLPTPNAQPWDITALPDGTFWFTEENVDQVGRIDLNGNIEEFPTGEGQLPTFIATGPAKWKEAGAR